MKTTLTLRILLLMHACLLFSGFANAAVNPTFTYTPGCNGIVTFTATNQTYSSYTWTFGDNSTATGATVTHDYSAQGSYNVTLTVLNSPDSDAYYSPIYVGQFIQGQITGPTDVCLGANATFNLTNPSGSLQYSWLASGASINGNTHSDSAQLTFSTVGNALLSVIINNGAGCDSIMAQHINVHPTPKLTVPGHAIDSSQVQFTICQNTPVWYHVLTSVPGTITWSSPTGIMLSPQGVDSMLFNFPIAGTTAIQISEITPWGCTDTVTALVVITANPSVSAASVSACLGTNNTFIATPNPSASSLSYQWIFDDGTQATGQDVAHTFATSGSHGAMVIGVNQNGCVDTASTTTQVDANPGPSIACVGPVCVGAQEVYSTPSIAGVSYHWSIAGGIITSGGSLNDNTIAVTWGNGAMGTVSLFLTGPGTYCQVPTTVSVPIMGGTLAIQGTATPCLYSYITYSTDIIPGGVYTWATTAGGIVSGQGTNQIQVYFNTTTAGTVSVTVNHQILTCSSHASLPVTPLSQFYVYGPTTVCSGIPVTFNTYATGNFNWTISGGTILSGNGTNTIQVLWNTAGNYSVTAQLNTGYCNTTASVNANVVTRKQEIITGNTTSCNGSNETYFISSDEGSYSWKLMHGGAIIGSSNSNAINVTWNISGLDTVRVIYSDINGCPDTAYLEVNIAPQNVPYITGDTVACFGTTINYSYTPVAGVSYVWETQGGVITAGQGTSAVSVMWTGTQTGVVRLRNTACNTFRQTNVVIRPTPKVDIETLNLSCAGASADLKVVQDYPSYNWSNGGNTQDILITVPAVYTVTVTDSKGCTATGTENANPIPNNGFTYSGIVVSFPSPPYPYVYAILYADASPQPTSFLWSDGNTEQTDYVASAGIYSVTITNQYGCSAVLTTNVTAGTITGGGGPGYTPHILPCPGISPVFTTNSPVCNPVQFTPGVVATYYTWNFGDGVYSTLSNPTHHFSTAGSHLVYLNYSNDGTNWYQCSQNLVINSVMNIDFTDAGVCNGATTLTNTSNSALPVTSVLWAFGDGTTSATTPVVNHTYPNTASTFMVTLTLSDGVCTDSRQKQVSTNRLVANFTYSDVCKDNPALFNDATIHSNIIASYAWDFGNTETADYYDPLTYFHTAANYNVSLTVTDANGCSSVATQSVPVNQFGSVPVAASGPLTFCKGSSVNLSLPTGYSIYWNTGDTTQSIHVTQGGTYFAWVKDLTTGCSGFSDTVIVIENIPPAAFIGNPSGLNEICAGSTLDLQAMPPSGVTYNWYHNTFPGGNSSYIYYWAATVTQGGNYQLVITDGNGCKDTSAITAIIVNPAPALPVIVQTPSGNVCSGQPVTLSVSGPDLYNWNNGIIGNNDVVFQNGYYSVLATNSQGCTSHSAANVYFNVAPDFTLFPTGCYQICQSSNVTVTGPAGMQTYHWSNGANTQSITLSTSGTYSLSATATDGCSGQSGSFSIDVFGSANLNLGNDTTICAGQTVVLNAGAYPTIKWQDNSTNQTFTVVDSGLYYVQVTTSQGCITSDSIHVIVDTIKIDLGNDTSICGTLNLPLAVNGTFATILWQDGSTNAVNNVTQPGFYKVNVTDAFGCHASDSITITSSTTSVDIGNDTALCFSSTLNLLANGNFTSIVWQDGSTNPGFTVTQAGFYKVTVTNAAGCTASDSITVTVHSPSVNLGNDTTLCNINNYVLSVVDTFATIVWQNGSTGSTYTVTQSGEYHITATDFFGCVAIDSIHITSISESVHLGNDTVLCNHNTLQLHVNGNYSSVVWQDGSTGNNFLVTQTGLYFVDITDAHGCTASDSIVVTIHSPTVNLGDDTTLCANSTLQLNASGNFVNIVWQNHSTGSTYVVHHSGLYYVTVTDSFGCKASDSIHVSYYPAIQFDCSSTVRLCTETVNLSVGGPFSSYSWSNGTNTEYNSVSTFGTYWCTVTDHNGCTASDSINVLTCDTNPCRNHFFIPNVFTPNGDGHNDQFGLLKGNNVEPSEFFSISIFDRTGERVFETTNETDTWDGQFRGKPAAPGVYVYIAKYVCNGDHIDTHGAVTLLR